MCGCKKIGNSGNGPHPSSAEFPEPVETYSGYRLHERPRRFFFQGEWLEVRRVLARWQEPENLSFIVAANDSCTYLLKYDYGRDSWEVLIWRGPEPSSG